MSKINKRPVPNYDQVDNFYCRLGPVLFSDWPAHFRYPLSDLKGPRNAKISDILMRKNGAPPTFVLYTGFHYYGTQKNEFWQFSIEVIELGLEFFTILLPYI